jgi:plastocyanin
MGAAVALGQSGGPIEAQSNNTFNPAAVSVAVGETVRIRNQGMGNHDLHDGAGNTLRSIGQNWDYTSGPLPAGTHVFFCDPHGDVSGGMRVVVTASGTSTTGTTGTTTTGTTTTGTTTTPTTPTDTARPVVNRLRASTVTLRRAVIRLRLNEDAKVTARLRRRGSTRTLKRVTRDLQAGDRSMTIRYTLRPRARYRVALEVEDAAGNVTRRSVSFRAPRP